MEARVCPGARSGGISFREAWTLIWEPLDCRDGWKELSGLCSGAGHGDFQVIGCAKGWRVWEPVSCVCLVLCSKDVYVSGNPQGGRIGHNQICSLWSRRGVTPLKMRFGEVVLWGKSRINCFWRHWWEEGTQLASCSSRALEDPRRVPVVI